MKVTLGMKCSLGYKKKIGKMKLGKIYLLLNMNDCFEILLVGGNWFLAKM